MTGFNYGVYLTSIMRRGNCSSITPTDFTSIPPLSPLPWTNITFTQDSPTSYIIRYNSNGGTFLTSNILPPDVKITHLEERIIDLETCRVETSIRDNRDTDVSFGGISSGSRTILLNNISLPGRIIVIRSEDNILSNNITGYFYINIDETGASTTSY
jgi:hypothetical protein